MSRTIIKRRLTRHWYQVKQCFVQEEKKPRAMYDALGISNDAGATGGSSSQQLRRNSIVLTMELAVEIYSQRPAALLDNQDSAANSAMPGQPVQANHVQLLSPSEVHMTGLLHPGTSRGEAGPGVHTAGREGRNPPARRRPPSLTSESQQVAARYGVSPSGPVYHPRRLSLPRRSVDRPRYVGPT